MQMWLRIGHTRTVENAIEHVKNNVPLSDNSEQWRTMPDIQQKSRRRAKQCTHKRPSRRPSVSK